MNQFILNGEVSNIEQKLTIQELVHKITKGKVDGIAVAMNGTIVSRNKWHIQEVLEGSQIDIVESFQGG